MPERKNFGILSLKEKKLHIFEPDLKTIRRLQCGSFLLIRRLILVRICSEILPRNGKTSKISFLGTSCLIGFG